MPTFEVGNTEMIEGQKALKVTRKYKAGEVIAPISDSVRNLKTASRYTVQIAMDEHMVSKELSFLNHSCDPNTYLDTENMQLVALKDLDAGDELSFFYPSTEWDMAEPFICSCSTMNCLQQIKGAKYLDPKVLKRFQLNKHIASALSRENGF